MSEELKHKKVTEKNTELKTVTERKTASRAIARRPRVVVPEDATPIKLSTAALVHMFDSTTHLLEETLKAGKLNPAQGLIGMAMIADLLHGGAYKAAPQDRPAMGGKNAHYYNGPISIEQPDMYPVRGINFLDPIGSFFGILSDNTTNDYAKSIISEIYLNANVPHMFPKLLSDEAYAKIMVLIAYLSHSAIVQEAGIGVKTFVEGSAIPVKTAAEAIKDVMPSGEQMKQLLPMLSLLEGA